MKILKRKTLKSTNGITLIALVITIIVLLILAGISIGMLAGDNSILQRAAEAKEKTDEAQEKESIELAIMSTQIKNKNKDLTQTNIQDEMNNQFGDGKAIVMNNEDGTFTITLIDSKKDYNIISDRVVRGINWNESMLNTVAPDEQTLEGVIGIGTDGKPVNMDLWAYTLLDDNTYALNYETALAENENYSASSGYKGAFENGKIIGTIPVYISEDGGKNYYKVTSLENTFRKCTELEDMPIIPFTIKRMVNTFCDCNNLTNVKSLPYGVTNLSGLFARTSIAESPEIPKTVTNMTSTFTSSSLEKSPEIPNSVLILNNTFATCKNLVFSPTSISENVNDMFHTFYYCYKLEGKIEINANPEEYRGCFENCSIDAEKKLLIYGESNMLETLYNTKSNNSKIELYSKD